MSVLVWYATCLAAGVLFGFHMPKSCSDVRSYYAEEWVIFGAATIVFLGSIFLWPQQ